MLFSTERLIRKQILDANNSKYIPENADPDKVVAETIRLVQIELVKQRRERMFKNQQVHMK